MIDILQPFADLPGVRIAMLVTPDGVPIVIPGKAVPGPGEDPLEHGPLGQDDALAALATGWLTELDQHLGSLSWNQPQRMWLRAARGTLIMQRTHNSILLVVLAPGLDPEDIRLSMDGVIARIERSARSRAAGSPSALPSDHGAGPHAIPPGELMGSPTSQPQSIQLNGPAKLNQTDQKAPSEHRPGN